MANEIRIQPPVETLVRGQNIAVPIVLMLEQRLKARGIHAKFFGAEETKADYTTTSTNSKGQVTTQTHTAVQHVEITSQDHLLAGNKKMGFFGNMSDAMATVFGAGTHDTLEPGEHEFSVEVSIPEDVPATHVGQKTRVFYELSIHVDVPAGFDLKATQSFQVEPLPMVEYETAPVRTRYPDDEGRGLFDSFVSPNVRVEMALVADKYQLHETIKGIFTIKPEQSLKCRRIIVQLIGIQTAKRTVTRTDMFTKGNRSTWAPRDGDRHLLSGILTACRDQRAVDVTGSSFRLTGSCRFSWTCLGPNKIRTPIVLLSGT